MREALMDNVEGEWNVEEKQDLKEHSTDKWRMLGRDKTKAEHSQRGQEENQRTRSTGLHCLASSFPGRMQSI